jgi:hypothetical protein
MRRRSLWCLACLLLLPALCIEAPPKLCAVGDLHGDMDHALEALQLCGAVDGSWKWTGGTMTVVQTGDVLDRGHASLPLLQALWALRDEAAAAGGELLLLLGNHELLNLQGATYYVDKHELHAYGKAAWKKAMDPNSGELGQRLVTHPGAAVRGSGACRTLFLHAGLRHGTAAAHGSLDQLNAQLRAQVQTGAGPLLDAQDGPLWFRGYARPHASGLSDEQACAEADAALRKLGDGATRMVLGHNIVPFVSSRCEGRVQLIDVGMSGAYGGRPAVWSCSADGEGGVANAGKAAVRALYREGEEEPPPLCDACASLRRTPGGGAQTLRGGDPHNDCLNYCREPQPSGLSRFFGGGVPELSGSGANHAKVEF